MRIRLRRQDPVLLRPLGYESSPRFRSIFIGWTDYSEVVSTPRQILGEHSKRRYSGTSLKRIKYCIFFAVPRIVIYQKYKNTKFIQRLVRRQLCGCQPTSAHQSAIRSGKAHLGLLASNDQFGNTGQSAVEDPAAQYYQSFATGLQK